MTQHASTLVIGYGNDLRSDDGAGRVVADRIGALELPGVTTRSLSQLTPELSLDIAGVNRVVFVDASIEVSETTLTPVVAAETEQSGWTHYTTPATLLAMASTVGATPDSAYTVSIPVADLGLGMELSPITAAGVDKAVDLITGLICE
ncbi:MAG: hydrogenase maturation protease [Acidimicrobiia bacterium]|nr:hydrogenase maturation protease [Acidimicrobiia bacterium]